ncbi:hypothetical protein [Vibrio mexicanus]|uniref:hypothetical protein n=1 Tax=Vibrio mexicanus TaxID=1004326 RepID=UPI00063C8FDC|nr:hypothetical protein [Vibrio mexicanus]
MKTAVFALPPDKTTILANQENSQQETDSNREESKLNSAIMLATTQLDPLAMSKFCHALNLYRDKHQDSSSSPYWLLMHAIRCYLFGTTFQWGVDDEASMVARHSKKPMFTVIEKLNLLITRHQSEPELWQCLIEQLSYFPNSQQNQCLVLGIAFRPELLDRFELTHQAHREVLNLDNVYLAKSWLDSE